MMRVNASSGYAVQEDATSKVVAEDVSGRRVQQPQVVLLVMWRREERR
jgi:hypothetical protein